MKEIETKILDFDEDGLRKNLKLHGGKYIGKSLLKRVVFDLMPGTTEQDEIIRIRTDGKRTTLTWKVRDNRIKKLDNTEELEVEVDDFDKTVEIISKIWKGPDPYHQESKLEKWDYKNVEIAICTWPLVPPFLEIEGQNEEEINKVIDELKIGGTNIGNHSLAKIFERYGQNGKDAGDLRF
jgi:adenylate cyclase, class 2